MRNGRVFLFCLFCEVRNTFLTFHIAMPLRALVLLSYTYMHSTGDHSMFLGRTVVFAALLGAAMSLLFVVSYCDGCLMQGCAQQRTSRYLGVPASTRQERLQQGIR